MALEAIFLLLDGKIYSWEELKKKIVDPEQFKTRILHLKIEDLKKKNLEKFKKDYVQNKNWDLEKLKKASKVMNPLGDFFEAVD